MAIEFHLQMDEGPLSIGAESQDYAQELRYFAHVSEKESKNDVINAAKEETPSSLNGLVRTRISVPRRITFDTVFECIVEYVHPSQNSNSAPTQVGEFRMTVRSDYSSSQRMDFSLEARRYTAGQDPVQLTSVQNRAIGVQPNGTIEGAHVSTASAAVIVETVKAGTQVSTRYLLNCALAQGRVNGFPYKGFPKGTMMLTNFDASEQAQPGETVPSGYVANWNLTFSFSFIPNSIANIALENGRVRVPVEGHQLLDVFKTDAIMPMQVQGQEVEFPWPIAQWATVHRVREYEDFETLLGI